MIRHDSHLDRDWDATVARLGGAASPTASAWETKALRRPPRAIPDATALLCLGDHGPRLTAAWAAVAGIAQISNVRPAQANTAMRGVAAPFGRRQAGRARAARGPLIRVVDATTVRMAWRNGRWLNQQGEAFDFRAAFKAAPEGLIDQPIQLCRKGASPLQPRLAGTRPPRQAAEVARRGARDACKTKGYTISDAALEAADWVIAVTSLDASAFTAADILALYRLRWRVELAFKRLKSVIGLKGPPNQDPGTAKVFILAFLVMILLFGPLIGAFEDSPRWAKPPDAPGRVAPAAAVVSRIPASHRTAAPPADAAREQARDPAQHA